MYFGKPIPEWITEHRNDTITLGEIVDYCEASARVSEQLRKRIADTDFAHDYDLSAYSFFTREEREVNRAIDVAVGILGERYGYPDNAPQDDENPDNAPQDDENPDNAPQDDENPDDDHIDEDIHSGRFEEWVRTGGTK